MTLFGCPQWVSAREKFQQAANLIDAEQRMKKSMWGQFWSAHQRFFKYLCIASKVHRVVQLAREEVKHGKVGTQSAANLCKPPGFGFSFSFPFLFFLK